MIKSSSDAQVSNSMRQLIRYGVVGVASNAVIYLDIFLTSLIYLPLLIALIILIVGFRP